jgi:hypothetical protein
MKMECQSDADPPSKRQRTIAVANDTSDSSTNSTVSPQDEGGGVLAAIEKLTQLVEHHPSFHFKLEEMLKDVYNTLEPEVPAATRKEKNEVSCPIYKLSNDELKLIFGYAGEKQYCFIACVSDRFHHV